MELFVMPHPLSFQIDLRTVYVLAKSLSSSTWETNQLPFVGNE